MNPTQHSPISVSTAPQQAITHCPQSAPGLVTEKQHPFSQQWVVAGSFGVDVVGRVVIDGSGL